MIMQIWAELGCKASIGCVELKMRK